MADLQSVKDDIAFMRALATEGRSAPLLGGAIMIAAGLIFASASVAHYTVAATGVHLTPWIYPIIWFGAAGVFMLTLAVLKARYRGRAGSLSPGNRAMRGVWRGVAWAIFALFAVLAIAAWKLDDPVMFGLLPSGILILYGAAWTLAAQMSELKWTGYIAALSFILAVGMALLLQDARIYLAYAAALLLTAALPGWLLMRQEPSDVV
jgi:hypothetical protein